MCFVCLGAEIGLVDLVEEDLGIPRGCCRGPYGQCLVLSYMHSCLSWSLRIPVDLCVAPVAVVWFAASSLLAALAGSTRAVSFLTTTTAAAGL